MRRQGLNLHICDPSVIAQEENQCKNSQCEVPFLANLTNDYGALSITDAVTNK